MAYQRLRLGFKLSVVSVILFTTASVEPFASLFLLYPLGIIYALSIHERTSGWKLLGFQDTYRVMWVCAVILVLSPFLNLFGALFWATTYAFLIGLVPLALWGLYTFVENRSLAEPDKKLNSDLRPARIFALLGALFLGVVYCYGLYTRTFAIFPFLVFLFASSVFAAPFLILSCLILMKRLKPTSKLGAT